VRFIRGTGFVMWGQKTAQQKKSALDRISVRRNLLFMENNIEIALFPFTFENNTVQTRLRVFSLIDNFLAGVQAGGGLTDYEVVVDETNNTPTIIDSNQMNVDVYVQPTRTAEFIQFTTIVTRTGISFSDVRLKYS
jgi:phage tail sheath protein FI